MNDLMAYIDRRVGDAQRAVHDFDGANDAGAETAGLRQNDLDHA